MKEYVKLDEYSNCNDIVVRTTVQIGEYKGKFETMFERSPMHGSEAIICGIFGVSDTEEDWTPLGRAQIEKDDLFRITLVNKEGKTRMFTITYLSELNPHIVNIKIVKNEPYNYSI